MRSMPLRPATDLNTQTHTHTHTHTQTHTRTPVGLRHEQDAVIGHALAPRIRPDADGRTRGVKLCGQCDLSPCRRAGGHRTRRARGGGGGAPNRRWGGPPTGSGAPPTAAAVPKGPRRICETPKRPWGPGGRRMHVHRTAFARDTLLTLGPGETRRGRGVPRRCSGDIRGTGKRRFLKPPDRTPPPRVTFRRGPWTVTRSSLRMLRRVAAFCRPLRPVLLLVSFPRSGSPVVGVLGLW